MAHLEGPILLQLQEPYSAQQLQALYCSSALESIPAISTADCSEAHPLTTKMNLYESNSLRLKTRESHILRVYEGKRLQLMSLTWPVELAGPMRGLLAIPDRAQPHSARLVYSGENPSTAGALSPKADQMNQIH